MLFRLWVACATVGWSVSAVSLVVGARIAWRLRSDGVEGVMTRALLVRELVIFVEQSGYLFIAGLIIVHFHRIRPNFQHTWTAALTTVIFFLDPCGLLFYSVHGFITRARVSRALQREERWP